MIKDASGKWKHTEEELISMRHAQLGRKHTLEARKKISEKNKGNHKHTGKRHSEETKRLLSELKKGKPSPRKGAKHTKETRIKMSCRIRGIPVEEFDKFIWCEGYCEKFDTPFKERVREFFGRRCVECGKDEKDNGRNRLYVHHVNYDKQTCCNTASKLFVCLCGTCHSKTNGNREYWKQHFTDIINTKYKGNCYLPKE
jgi:hypothetical protein